MSQKFFKPVHVNVTLMAFLSFCQALQALIICSIISSFIPFKSGEFVATLFPVYLPEVRPEREMLLYRLFIVMAIAFMAVWVWRQGKNIEAEGWWRKYVGYACFSAVTIFIQLFFVFKVLVVGAPTWAVVGMHCSVVIAIAAHIFWPEINHVLATWLAWISKKKIVKTPSFVDVAVVAGFAMLLLPRNMDHVLGRMFVQDQFYHLDSLIMSPGHAHLKGLVLDQDVISQYSITLPIVISNLLAVIHHFDYLGAVVLIIVLSITYYAVLYFFMSSWLSSRALGFFGALFVIKLQMFHWGVAPLVWQFPSATVLRHWPDIVFLITFWRYLLTNDVRWLWASALIVGGTLCWMIDVGIYLLAALCVGVLLINWRQIVVVLGITLIGAAGILLLVQPQAVFHLSFWTNQAEFALLFLQGWGALPMSEGLKDKQFFAFVVGFTIPILYVANLLYSVNRYWAERVAKQYVFLVVLSVYGLGLYHYFIHRSGVTSYYAVCVPFVMIFSFWLGRLIALLPQVQRRIAGIMAASFMLPVLMTSYLFTYYPNVFNISGFNWNTETNYYRAHFTFGADAKLIASLTKPEERVAIISSFETKILMEADRAPFFYFTPLVESSLMDDPKARLTYLHTYDRVRKTLAQIEGQKPAYIFIERKMLAQQGQQALNMLLSAINKQYRPSAQGKYLIAYQRIGS